MNGSDRWFRFSLNFFIFLMFFQLGSLLVLRSSYQQAQNYVQENKAKVDFQCGDFNNDESYWNLNNDQPQLLSSCLDPDCPESLYIGDSTEEQEKDLHVLSVASPWPYRWEGMNLKRGNFVEVEIKQDHKPMTLVLVSQAFMLWDLKLENTQPRLKEPVPPSAAEDTLSLQSLNTYIDPENWLFPEPREIDEVIVVSPELVWVEGLDPQTKVTYFDQKQICAYPTAWEEIHNSGNQFRRLTRALKKYTGLNITHFQGRELGRQFKVPYRNLLAEKRADETLVTRQLASAQNQDLGLQWQRQGDQLQAVAYRYRRDGQVHEVSVPAQTTQAYYELANATLFLINNHQLGTWDAQAEEFKPLHLPLRMPAMYWPTALTFNPLTSELLVYNDDRGGEVLAYNVVTNSWRFFARQVGYSLMALSYDISQRQLLGARYQGRKITDLVKINEAGQTQQATLSEPVDFSKRGWRAQLSSQGPQLWLKVHHPAQPAGDWHPLQGS